MSLAAEHGHAVASRPDVQGTPLVRAFAAFRAHVVSLTKPGQHAPEVVERESPELWLLLEQPCGPGPHRQDELKQYGISGPATLTLDQLADLAHRRPLIERSYENAQQEVGLADDQGRSWPGFHHHLAMVWVALTYLLLARRRLPPPPPAFSQPTPPPPPAATQSPPDPAPPSPSSSAERASASASVPPPPQPASLARILATLPNAVPVAVLAPRPLPLRHPVWESVQAVHSNLCEWFAAMRTYEHIFAILSVQKLREHLQAGTLPPLPALRPLLPAGP